MKVFEASESLSTKPSSMTGIKADDSPSLPKVCSGGIIGNMRKQS